ncbi:MULTISPECIES: hypothetical protein [unclassified Arsukibacterium]|uniref:hypothetical protein n=1 Tax=unclassified Arsukibacterium TaxID=2635278 RepID=UPI000C48EE0B|nr:MULTISPECIES: hypothetical protein [unclassified Arsukibacterium]MAA96105.1 hypothetical protein [Rheinheimera sp.]MBM35453.1 hypothetical protein [Rheinheimera sp.]HAW93629.1 hypothetical protein [Candidatus Azambacteria bacterium]|tara:strand:- start:14534 stop:14911 length:378 start_codon:yes stop_codon:yes gene_type:complete
MARVAATKIDVQDLEYVIEYLLVFTVSRRAYNSDTTITKGKNRVKLLQAALTLEKAMLELRDQEYLDAVDRVCVDIEGIMVAALCPADIQKLRSAIRQKRYKNDGYSRADYEYESTIRFLLTRSS